ncbi:S16 family serine protease [[Mycoplasma] testudinis]|uniref:S16 family serine protease n=1 Tax=[Mycoplasma] testudinis TaxID=33924 RepID=UPI0006986232|nr:S16 family serine protease [[Mycoplasma] testudinis]
MPKLKIIIAENTIILPGMTKTIIVKEPFTVLSTIKDMFDQRGNYDIIVCSDIWSEFNNSNKNVLSQIATLCKIQKITTKEISKFNCEYTIKLIGITRVKLEKSPKLSESKQASNDTYDYSILPIENSKEPENLEIINQIVTYLQNNDGISLFSDAVLKLTKLSLKPSKFVCEFIRIFYGTYKKYCHIIYASASIMQQLKYCFDLVQVIFNEQLIQKNNGVNKEETRLELVSRIIQNSPTNITMHQKLVNKDYSVEALKGIINLLHLIDISQSGDQASIETAISYVLDLPWNKKSISIKNLKEIQKELDSSHYGLEKVKQEILHAVAVYNRNPEATLPILCLAGSPGVGKSTLVNSIAKALGRPFARISLGGITDACDLNGFSRAYINSKPGLIISSFLRVGVNNPVILLDEVDKVSNQGTRGNPVNVLLEVLDKNLNKTFKDIYLDVPFDLSNALFIATANYLENIPEPLLDRMQIINVEDYSANEKLTIAKNYIIPKLLKESAVKPSELKFEDEAIEYIIKVNSTKGGIRSLESSLQSIISEFCYQQELKKCQSLNINLNYVKGCLSEKNLIVFQQDTNPNPGVTNVLYVSSYALGGIDTVEVVSYEGTGKITITGNLKKVMQESVEVAYGFVKKNCRAFNISADTFKNKDIQVHFPNGIGKDGPSAGISIVTAIISELTNNKIPADIAMTGEITLTGVIRPVGAIKKKILGASNAGIKKVFLPQANFAEWRDNVSEELECENLSVVACKNYFELYDRLMKLMKKNNSIEYSSSI